MLSSICAAAGASGGADDDDDGDKVDGAGSVDARGNVVVSAMRRVSFIVDMFGVCV